jgi:glycosyltransferase involved in cell wall biosynthesis
VPEASSAASNLAPSADDARPVVALLPWGHMLEDFLIPNRLSLDDFCGKFTGSWIFGYVDALHAAGLRALIVCISSGVDTVTRRIHGATGAEICLLPVPRLYRLLRKGMRFPYGRTVSHTFRGPRPVQLALYPLLFAAKELAPYLSTPARTLARELQRDNCRTIVCQEYEFPRFDVCVELGRLSKVAVFATFQGGDYQRWRLERIVRPLSIRRAAGLIVPSAAEIDRVRSRYRPRALAWIANPIDLEIWRPQDGSAGRLELEIPETARVVAWHGRIDVWKKGLDTLVDAWARVSATPIGENAVLLLLGTGADAATLRRRIEELRLANVVWVDRYLHERTEIARLLAAADVYAFTSRHEGFPLAPLEAMACGLPVVTTDVSGIRDVLAEGEESGGVVVPSDDPERLAEELGRLLEDVALSSGLGQAARVRANAFGTKAIGDKLRAFLFAGKGCCP